jgi:CHASE2 domain-containing sensor protein
LRYRLKSMEMPDNLKTILDRIVNGQQTDADLEALRNFIRQGNAQNLLSQYNVNIEQISGGDVQVGDRTYTGVTDEVLKTLIQEIQQQALVGSIDRFIRCKPRTALLTSLGATVLLAIIRFAGLLQPLELATYDHLLQTRSHTDPNPQSWQDDRLAIIEVTDDDIAEQKQRGEDLQGTSISHASLLRLLQTLDAAKPIAVGLDLYRDGTPPDRQSAELAQRFRTQTNLFAICKVDDKTLKAGEDRGDPPLGVPADRIGFSDFSEDADGILRRQLLAFRETSKPQSNAPCQADRALHLQLANSYLQQKQQIALKEPFDEKGFCNGITFSNGFTLPTLQFFTSGYQGESTIAGCQLLLNYRTQPTTEPIAPLHTLTQVLRGQVPITELQGRIVLIGSITGVSEDIWKTPFTADTPGIYLQAQMVSQILRAVESRGQNLIWVLPQWGEFFWILGWASIGSGLGWWLRSPRRLIIAVSLSILLLYISCLVLFLANGWLPLLPSVLALISTSGGMWGLTLRRNLGKQQPRLVQHTQG